MTQAIVISDFKTGYETDIAPVKLSNDAFPTIENAMIWRNRLKVRDGVKLLGRLKRELTAQSLGNTDAQGRLTVNLFTFLGLEATSSVVPGSVTVTIGAQTFTEPTPFDGTLIPINSGIGSINYATGAIDVQTNPVLATQAATITFEYYPGLPVLGISNFDTPSLNNEVTICFDNRYAYEFNNTEFIDASFYKMASPRLPVTWHGANYQQYWDFNYRQAMWVTNNVPGQHALSVTVTNYVSATGVVTTSAPHGLSNGMVVTFAQVTGACGTAMNGKPFVVSGVAGANFTITAGLGAYTSGGVIVVTSGSLTATDGIRWYDGNLSTLGFSNFQPPLYGTGVNTVYLRGALVGCVFKDRVIFFNTWEGTAGGVVQQFPQRARYCQNGTPFFGDSPSSQTTDPLAWDQTTPGKGGFIDCPTNEFITGIAQNKDICLVFFERSTYRLVYTGNEVLPFVWQKINDQLGVESTFSPVQFDTYALGFGQTGLYAATTNDVQRLDDRIPYTIFEIRNDEFGPQRVCGNINYFDEVVYFAYPTDPATNDPSFVYNNRILVYNYVNKSFAIFKENVTALGYSYATTGTSLTWGNADIEWGNANFEWGTAQFNTGYRYSTGGNQKGYVFTFIQGLVQTDPLLNIDAVNTATNQLTITNHGFSVGDAFYVENAIGITNLNYNFVNGDGNYIVQQVVDNNNVIVNKANGTPNNWSGTYKGLGQVVKITIPNIVTKEFNLYLQLPVSIRVNEVNFLTATTNSGSFVCKLFNNSNVNNPATTDLATNLGSTSVVNGITVSNSDIVTTYPINLLLNTVDQEFIWSPLQNSVTGQSIRMQITYDARQIAEYNAGNFGQLIIQAFVIYYTSSGRLII